jgi:outer membrane protein
MTAALIIALAVAVDSVATPDLGHPWTLAECMDWALEHNLSVVQQEMSRQSSEIDLNSAQWSLAPAVQASASENWSFGRGLGGDNTYASGNSSTTGFSIGAGVNLFDGLATPNRISQARLNLDAATADLEKARDDIRVSVAQAYVQILYNYEILDVARQQITIDSLQVARLEGLLRAGKASSAELSQQKASLAQSQVTLVQAENNLRVALLDLAQLLEFPTFDGFSVVRPEVQVEDFYLGTPDDIYDQACGLRPAVRAEQLRLDASDKSIAIAKAAYMPSLSLSAGLGTNYYSNYGGKGFWDQMNDNFSQYVGLSLSIPIFNKFSTRNQVRSAQLSRTAQQVRLRQVQQQLYKEIQQAWNGAVAARAKYDASLMAASAAQDAFELVQAKYENGKATITEFNESRTQMLKTRSDAIQATYEYVFQTSLVNFYRGGTLDL